MNYKYYKVTNNDDIWPFTYPLSIKLKSITGFYANDYINPVVKEGGEIVTIIADESKIHKNEQYSYGLIILPIKVNNSETIESNLKKLINKYKISSIHFTDIFGRKNILANKKEEFCLEYADIVKDITMSAVSVTMTKDEILGALEQENPTEEDIYFFLFWNVMGKIIKIFPSHSIFHIHTEQEHSMEGDLEKIARRYFEKLYSGIDQINLFHPEKYVSICKHPYFFSKNALIQSSLADLLAYGSNRVQSKINQGLPNKKILKNKDYKLLIYLFKSIFNNYTGVSSDKFVELINES